MKNKFIILFLCLYVGAGAQQIYPGLFHGFIGSTPFDQGGPSLLYPGQTQVINNAAPAAGVLTTQSGTLQLQSSLPAILGGTGLAASPFMGSLLIGNSLGSYNLNTLSAGTGIDISNGSGTIAISLATPVSVANGGTGNPFLTSPPNGTTLIGNGSYFVNSYITGTNPISVTNGSGSITIGIGFVIPVGDGGTGNGTGVNANYGFFGPDSAFDGGSPAFQSFRPMHPFDLPPYTKYSYFFTDFLGVGSYSSSANISDNLYLTLSGAGSSLTPSGEVINHPGIAELFTGTTSSGYAEIGTQNVMSTGNGGMYFESIIQIPALSNSTQRFFVRDGFSNAIGTDGSNAIEFRYIDSLNGGDWQIITANSGTQTVTNTTSAPVAGNWYHLGIRVTANDSCIFYINGTNVGVITSNVPASSNSLYCFVSIAKDMGSTASDVYVDAMEEYTYVNR